MGFNWDRSLFKKSLKRRSSFINLEELELAIEKAIVDDGSSSKEVKKVSFAPSSFGYSGACSRYWFYSFRGANFESSPDALGLFAMRFGTDAGDRLEKALLAEGVAESIQGKIINDFPPVFGYYDFISEFEGERFVADFKTCGSDKFDTIVSTGVAPKDNMAQILIYMKILKLRSGLLIYINRDTGKMVSVPVSVTEEYKKFIEYAFKWMEDVKAYADEEEIPPQRCFTKSTFVCKGCPVNKICWEDDNEKGRGPGKLEIDISKLDL